MYRTLLPWLFILLPLAMAAQSNYTQTNFRMVQGSYNDISGSGTSIAMTDPESGNSVTPQNIGFNFTFDGTSFSQFMIHADGLLKLGTAAPGGAADIGTSNANTLATAFTTAATSFKHVIMPLLTDLVAAGSTPQFHVLTSGTAPNRVCTVQWKNLRDADNPGSSSQHQFSDMSFQVKLYETTNDIEIIYGTWTPSAAGITAQRRFAAAGIKASSSSFLAIFRNIGTTPYNKLEILSQPNFARLGNSSQPYAKNNPPQAGFTMRFFGQVSKDVSIGKLYTDSVRAAGIQSAGQVTALVKNEGTSALTNIAVKLQVTGANTHTETINVANLAAGGENLVTFAAFDAPSTGQQTLQVTATAADDERADNNSLTATQVVSTTHTQVYNVNKNSGFGIGFNNALNSQIATKIYGSGTRKISQVRVPFNQYARPVILHIYEDAGAGGLPGGAPLFSSSAFNTTNEQELIIPIIPAIEVTGDFYVGLQQASPLLMGWSIGIQAPLQGDRTYNNTSGTWNGQTASTPGQPLVALYQENTTPDIGIELLTSPGCEYSTSTVVKATLRNFSNIAINFSTTPTVINGKITNAKGQEFPFTQTKNTGALAAGASEEITILNGYDFSNRGIHRFFATTNLPGDAERGNDSLSFQINNGITVTRSITAATCPLTPVTLTAPSFLPGLQWEHDGITGTTAVLELAPEKTTIVRYQATDYRGCALTDSAIIEISNTNLPPKPVLNFGDTILSYRNGFKDTVTVTKLAGHSIVWESALGTVVADSSIQMNDVMNMEGITLTAMYVREADGCRAVSDTLTYHYAEGIQQDATDEILVCDTSYYDFGGSLGLTGNTVTRTFKPATPGKMLKLTFYGVSLANNSNIQVFDGIGTSNRINVINSAANGTDVREFIASNPDGALTVQFIRGSSQAAGWWAGFGCYEPEVYRSITNGSWKDPAVWERKSGGVFVPATRSPMKGDDTIYVRHNVTLDESIGLDQVIVETSGHLTMDNGGPNFITILGYSTKEQPEYTVRGTLTTGGTTQLLGGRMVVTGRLNNDGRLDLDSVMMNGTAPQFLGNSTTRDGYMRKLVLNNPAGITLGARQTITELNFVLGMIHTSAANLLTLTEPSGFVHGARNEAHVDGPCGFPAVPATGDRLFPIGKNGVYRPVIVSNSSANGESGDIITAEVMSGPPPTRTLPAGMDGVSNVRYYHITRQGNTGENFTVTLPYGADDGVINHETLVIAKDDGGSNWLNMGGTATGPTPGTITSEEFNSFSDFVLASQGKALPVTWINFTGKPVNGDVLLQWQTAAETNCASYTVERSSDGIHFQEIGSKNCGTTPGQNHYAYNDVQPTAGKWYYRLKQLDNTGKPIYSAVITVNSSNPSIVRLFPNPAKNWVTITGLANYGHLVLYDNLGQRVKSQSVTGATIKFNLVGLAAGSYWLLVEQEGVITRHRLQVSR